MSGSDQAAQTPHFHATSRRSQGHFASLEVSGMITRCFVNAAVPHEPRLGPIGNGVIADVKRVGTWGPAHGRSCLPLASIKQTNEVEPGDRASIAVQRSFRILESSTLLAIISSKRFSASWNSAVRFRPSISVAEQHHLTSLPASSRSGSIRKRNQRKRPSERRNRA